MKVDPNDLRQRFLRFFDQRMKEHAGGKVKGSLVLPSSSLQPPDASTLFTSAGMHQFKDDFTGNLVHGTRAATTVQKCMRTPDLENVGKTARHHTFFEMLGFFSFGDGLTGPNGSKGFFKKEAIRWIWDFYTLPWDKGGCGLDTSKLYVSVYGGDEKGEGRDEEAASLWTEILGKLWKPDELKKRIFYLGEHDNFWPAGAPSEGPNGVCGPCSEIFFDLGDEYGQGDVASNGDRFMEIGNIVFTQYERSGPAPGKGTLTPLPAKNIDFGGGFERLVMVLDSVPTTLDSSLFALTRVRVGELIRQMPKTSQETSIYRVLAESELLNEARSLFVAEFMRPGVPKAFHSIVERAGGVQSFWTKASQEPLGILWNELRDCFVREKRIADHVRAALFCMSDGMQPSNEKQGYVIRNIIRRAYWDGRSLGFHGPFLHALIETVVGSYSGAYAELSRMQSQVQSVMEQEEVNFERTIARGHERLTDITVFLKKGDLFPGDKAFDLYSTYGLPPEVIKDECRTRELRFDQLGFDRAFDGFRKISGAGKVGSVFEKGWFQEVKGKHKPSQFLGYETCEAECKVIAIARNGELFDIIEAGDSAVVVLDRTPFYGESGGQVGDRGSLVHDESSFEVADTQKRDDYFLHEGKLLHGKLRVGDAVTARVDNQRRDRVRANHSATHLMHAALRKVLGDHVVQRGSEVGPDRLRFDFSHPKALTFEERQEIERLVNEQVQANTEVGTSVMAPEDAQKAGAMALFGEKYGDKVRVLTMGRDGFSKELCGGTHVARTGDIGYFRIVSEGSSSAGVRRIEAVTGQDAYELAAEEAKLLAQLHAATKAQPGKVLEKVEGLLKEVKDLKGKAKKGGGVDEKQLKSIRDAAETVGDVTVYVAELEGVDAPDLLTISDALRQDDAPSAILLGSRGEGRALLLLSFTKDLVGRGLHAGKIVGEMARLVGGGGGGKPEIAQAGGKNPEGMSEALATGRKRIREALEKA
ncbi:MAG: alanine--tRNA ligase [Planctomycetes bacterium]|nr:alanine--tRNA ligase [Planctomycetota bacterium]